MRFTLYFFIAAMTVAVPSVSMVGPTSLVLPPSAMITPSTSPPSKTFSTSSALVTEPLYLKSWSLSTGSSLPVEPMGVRSPAGSRHSALTGILRPRSWCVHSRPVRPVAPKTATDIEGWTRSALLQAAVVARISNFIAACRNAMQVLEAGYSCRNVREPPRDLGDGLRGFSKVLGTRPDLC